MEQLKNALNAHSLHPADFGVTLDEMNNAAPGSQWKCQKGNVSYTIIKNSQTSYNVLTDQ